MINDKFETMHLIEKRIATHLFQNAKQAYSYNHSEKKNIAKYIVIESKIQMHMNIFKNAPICPVFISNNKSYIFVEGECLWSYFLAHKEKDMVLAEQSIWKLLHQLCKCLIMLRSNGCKHSHLKEYAIRRINESTFKLIYHPTMLSISNILQSSENRWNKYYLAPQQLDDHSHEELNSCIFTLGAMMLNLMNPLDFARDIYDKQTYSVKKIVLNEKLNNCKKYYSNRLIEIIKKCVVIDFKERINLQRLTQLIKKQDPNEKKFYMIESIKDKVGLAISKSKQKQKLQNNSSIDKLINFQRGTFGGIDQQAQKQVNTSSKKRKVETNIKQKIKIFQEQIETDNMHKVMKDKTQNKHFNIGQTNDKNTSKSTVKDSNKDKDIPTLDQRYNIISSSMPLSNLRSTEDIIIDDQQSKELIEYRVNSLNTKVSDFHIKLAECLQTLPDLIKTIKFKPVQINQNTYYGPLVDGRRNGLGLEIFPNYQYYYGYFKNDLFHGQGFYFWNNNQYFLGRFDSGSKIEGTWTGKCKYIGQIKNNKRHGIGLCIYKTGRTYQGQWVNGKFQGSGIITEPSGQKFIGLFKKGVKYGKGYYLADKVRITGIWEGDKTNNKVEIHYENGNTYYGMINEQFDKSGQGQYKFKSGVLCQGEFIDDQFVFGQIKYANGQIYIGEVKQFQRNGSGKYYYNDGRIIQGYWVDNKCN